MSKNNVTLDFDTETALGEPQGWLYLSNGRSIEVTYESDGIADEQDRFFSVTLHCTEEEFENDVFHSTCGVVDVAYAENRAAVKELLNRKLDNLAKQGIQVV